MHNLSTVIRFEIIRALKKKSFWILAISFPLVFAATFGILFLSNKATDDAAEKLKEQSFSVAITDESNLVKPPLIAAAKAAEVKPSDKQAAINRVKDGQLDAYIYYPKNLDQQPIEIYGKDVGALNLRFPIQVKDYQSGIRNYSAMKVFQAIHEIRMADARSKGIDVTSSMTQGEIMKELLYKIMHWHLTEYQNIFLLFFLYHDL